MKYKVRFTVDDVDEWHEWFKAWRRRTRVDVDADFEGNTVEVSGLQLAVEAYNEGRCAIEPVFERGDKVYVRPLNMTGMVVRTSPLHIYVNGKGLVVDAVPDDLEVMS